MSKKTFKAVFTLYVILLIAIVLAPTRCAHAQDQKITQLSAVTSPAAADLLYVVINPGTSPASRKLTVDNLFKSRNGNNSVLAYASLSAAVSAISTTAATVEVPASTAVAADLTIPANITLAITGTGAFNVSSGKVLTINGSLQAPLRQIFTGSGSVVISSKVEAVAPQWFGAVGDARHVDDAAITSSTATLTSATAAFTSADVGKTVTVKGAGASGATLITTISAFTNSTTVTLAASASTTVSSKRAVIGTNDTAAMASAAASGARCIYLPKSTYLVRMTASGGGAVVVPSNTALRGDGAGSVVYCVGSDGKDGGGGGGTDDDAKAAVYVADGSSNVAISGLRFIGENGPYTEPSQNQSNIILAPGIGSVTNNVTIADCYFDNTFGFSVHCLGENVHNLQVTRCAFKNNANGLNANGDFVSLTFNSFDHCEGIESSSAYGIYSHNILNDCGLDSHDGAAISLGGRTSIGSWGLGCVISHNRIVASRSAGIVLADGFVEGQCVDNYILKSYESGIQQASSSGNDVDRNVIARNVVISCGHSGATAPYGIVISNGSDTKVQGNEVRDRSVASYATQIALVDYGTRTQILGNTFSGTSKDISFNGPSAWLGLDNVYDKTKIEVVGSGTLAAPTYRGYKGGIATTVATGILDISLATETAFSAVIHYRVYAEGLGAAQVRSGVIRLSAVNLAGTYTTEVAVVSEAASTTSGTLSATWSITTGTNKITLKVTPTSSLYSTLSIDYTLFNESTRTYVPL